MLLTLALLAAAAPPGCNSPRSQLAMNQCAAAAYAQADAAMTRQWRATYAYMRSRDARGGSVPHAAALLDSQRAWLRFRDAECAIEAARFAGGSVQPMDQAQCKTRLTLARTEQLRGLVWR